MVLWIINPLKLKRERERVGEDRRRVTAKKICGKRSERLLIIQRWRETVLIIRMFPGDSRSSSC
jgi:hypothetical protein